jgi:hypothetical protein
MDGPEVPAVDSLLENLAKEPLVPVALLDDGLARRA